MFKQHCATTATKIIMHRTKKNLTFEDVTHTRLTLYCLCFLKIPWFRLVMPLYMENKALWNHNWKKKLAHWLDTQVDFYSIRVCFESSHRHVLTEETVGFWKWLIDGALVDSRARSTCKICSFSLVPYHTYFILRVGSP